MTKPVETMVEMKFANMHGWSDVHPYEIVKVISDKTIEIRAMNATLDPNWKPEIVPGGFAGHCTNQSEQRWVYESNPDAPVIRMRACKPTSANRGYVWKSAYGHHCLSDKPRKFHDYNF